MISSVQRPEAVVPLIFSIIALTLSLLCVLAGSKPGYHESVNLFTVESSSHPQMVYAVYMSGQHVDDRA